MSKIQVFESPYNKLPSVWSVQGAKIFWQKQKSNDTNIDIGQNKTAAEAFYTLSSIRVAYQRTIATQYPIGSVGAPIMMLGAPGGTIQMAHLIGPTTKLQEFIQAAGSLCDTLAIKIIPFGHGKDCGNANSHIFYLYGCKSNGLSVNMQSGQGGISICQGGITLQFTNMSYGQN